MLIRKVACLHHGPCVQHLREVLLGAGWEVLCVEVPSACTKLAGLPDCHVGVICMPRLEPVFLQQLEQAAPHLRHLALIAIVEQSLLTDERTCDFIARHCVDYHTLPADPTRLGFTLGHAAGMTELCSRTRELNASDASPSLLIGTSPQIGAIRRAVGKVASVDAPVLITGESGTGKELVARAIHQQSGRHLRPLIAVNCASLPPSLIHAELFGFEKGAFTGAQKRKIGHLEAAHGGTIFLDEIGDLDAELQALLLRFLEEGTIRRIGGLEEIELDVRVIAATHVDVEAAVVSHRFREDLYFRLNVLRVHVPPLRERREDILPLAEHVLEHYAGERHGRLLGFSASAQESMRSHDWSGNVRELINRIRRAIVMSDEVLITREDLRLTGSSTEQRAASLGNARREVERQTLVAALESSNWSPMRAAAILGVSRATFYRLVGKHGLLVDDTDSRRGDSSPTGADLDAQSNRRPLKPL